MHSLNRNAAASLAAAGLAIATALVLVVPAWGHAAPERFNPSPGEVLAQAPTGIDGWFIQDVRRTEESSLEVLDTTGNVVSKPSMVDDADRRHMHADIQGTLEPGRYMAAWKTLSDEDDEADGACFLFFVGQEAADMAHEERVRIDDPDACPVKIAEEPAAGAGTETPAANPDMAQQLKDVQDQLAQAQAKTDDGGVSTGALAGAAAGAALAGLVIGAGVTTALRRRA